MGKTFVALAIARRFEDTLVIAPAALREMWRDALALSGVAASFATYEQLSRSDLPAGKSTLLILDEAHHARNPATHRYRRVARLARDASVLMLTATPIHNRRADLIALLSLFLGSRARGLTEREIARCVVRREKVGAGVREIPEVITVAGYEVPDDPGVVARLMSLPPPLPAREAGFAGTLINRGLVHQWASSEAALRTALQRRLTSATALIASLEAGRYPSAMELAAWTRADGVIQLGFPELLAPSTPSASALLESVRVHSGALSALLEESRHASKIDDVRAKYLQRISRESPAAKIVAFAQYSATVSAFYRRLARTERAAMLTASGAQVAGGKLTRFEAIERFAPRANRRSPPSRAERIDLLLATDLLSEGVNLQDAEIVVHLDIPWTAARLEQRVGRVARMGSTHSRVSVYRMQPPASAELVLRGQSLVQGKWDLARTLVGVTGANPISRREDAFGSVPLPIAFDRSPASIPSRVERLRAVLTRWVGAESPAIEASHASPTLEPGAIAVDRIPAAAVSAGVRGFVAACILDNAPALLVCRDDLLSTALDVQLSACLLANGSRFDADSAEYDQALQAIRQWSEWTAASESAGVAFSAPARRKRLLSRIDAMLQNAPPHVRSARARVATIARRVASASHGAALEEELEAFLESTISDDDWLNALASIAVRPKPPPAADSGFRLLGLLLLRP